MLAGLSMCVVIQATCQEYLMLTAECVGEKSLCRHCHSKEIRHTIIIGSTVILQTMNTDIWIANGTNSKKRWVGGETFVFLVVKTMKSVSIHCLCMGPEMLLQL